MKACQIILLLVIIALPSKQVRAQEAPSGETEGSVAIAAHFVSQSILAAAEQMPEEHYSFRPTPDVRSFGELMAHIAESNAEMTAIAKGESTPITEVAPTKDAVIRALKRSYEYSEAARTEMTVEQKAALVKFMGGERKAGTVLDFSVFHSLEHYGNVTTYMRLKGLTPPTSL